MYRELSRIRDQDPKKDRRLYCKMGKEKETWRSLVGVPGLMGSSEMGYCRISLGGAWRGGGIMKGEGKKKEREDGAITLTSRLRRFEKSVDGT